MKELTTALDELLKFLTDNPTLSHQRRALGTNGRLATIETVDDWIGNKLWIAGVNSLEQLHEELLSHILPQEREDDELEPIPVDKNGKPELTPEYLKSIGRLDILEFGTE